MDFKTKIKSTVATGTAPFDIASTTAVANLNADLLDGKHADAFATAVHTQAWSTITSTPTTVAGYGIIDAVLVYNGIKAAYANLPLSGQKIGDMYYVTADSVHYFWNGTAWAIVGGGSGVASDIEFTPTGGIAATNVQTAIAELDTEKAKLASPTFTGTPIAPTASVGTNTTQIATTAFVNNEIANDAQEKVYANAGAHNSIYRGKYLGSAPTAEQYLAISSGTFDDLFIGDYWTIGEVNYRIAAFNYFYNVGNTALTVNHAVIVPDLQMYAAQMNTTNITTGAYAGSLMRTAKLASAISTIESAFSGHVITHRQVLTNATNGGKASGFDLYDAKVELMNEVMVYGSSVWGVSDIGNGYNVGSSNGQLPLFALRHDMVHNRQNWWLRDVVSATDFARVSDVGLAYYGYASNSLGVRPAFSIS